MIHGWRRGTCAVLVGAAVLFVLWAGQGQAQELGGGVGFVLQVDLDGSGVDEVVIGVAARASTEVPEFSAPGDVLVFGRDPSDPMSSKLIRAFSCRDALPKERLPAFYHPSLVTVADLDGNSRTEVLLVWTERFWWPTAFRPLAALHFNQSTRTYEMVVDPERFVCGLGAYVTEDIVGDGRLEILEIKPVYARVTSQDDEGEGWECRYCPHYYEIRVIAFTGERFVPDPRFNAGEPIVTSRKYPPGYGANPVAEFLDDLIALVQEHAEGL